MSTKQMTEQAANMTDEQLAQALAEARTDKAGNLNRIDTLAAEMMGRGLSTRTVAA